MANDKLPQYTRETNIESSSSVPDFGNATRYLGSVSNGLGGIGAQVAQSASQQMAVKLGYESGKNPRGDLLPPINDFDKTYAQAYQQQAQATLSLQANKLMMDSQVELAKATRLTPDLIARTNNQVAQGLQTIMQQAPTAIKTQLGYSLGSQLQNQNANLQIKMIGQQKEDQTNLIHAGIDNNLHNAANLAIAGNQEAADKLVQQTKALAQSGVNSRLITPESAQVAARSIQDAAKNGKYINQALTARSENKLEEFYKDFATKKPADLTYEEWAKTGSSMASYVGVLDNLKRQDENLRVAQFNTSMAQDVTGITGSMIQDLKENVSPIQFEQAHLSYIRSLKAYQKAEGESNALVQTFNDPEAFARATEKQKNQAFDTMVMGYQKQREDKGIPITRDEAEVQIAASAGGSVPVFTNSLNNKLASQNPVQIESAIQQIHQINQMNSGNALMGLSTSSEAVAAKYAALRDSMDPNEAAKLAHETVYNKDPETETINEQKWTHYLSNNKSSGQTNDTFALKQVGLNSSKMISPTVYGNDILNEYKTYYTLLNGDQVAAKKMLQQSVNKNYGETLINGRSEITKHPIEKVLNLPHDSIGVIQQDIYEQLDSHLKENKSAYDSGHVNEYWELPPRLSVEQLVKEKSEIKNRGTNQTLLNVLGKNTAIEGADFGKPIEIVRHQRNGKSQKYTVAIQMSPYASLSSNAEHPIVGGWDIAVNSESGLRPLSREAPYLGIISYSPNLKSIQANYLALHPLK